MAEIPADAVRAAADAYRKARCTHTLGSSCAECRALASLRAAAPFLAEQARREERSKIVADLFAEGERESERLREVYGLGPADKPCRVSAAINNAITGWAFAARFVEGEQPKPPMVIRDQPGHTTPKEIGHDT